MTLLHAHAPSEIRHTHRVEPSMTSRYVGPMAVTANQAAAALRVHLPQVDGTKLHWLLYYVQGHHLAYTGKPAFPNRILASTNGAAVEDFVDQHQPHTPGVLDDWLLNVVLAVATRYGKTTTGDLDRLARAEPPWQNTMAGQAINHAMMRAFFTGDGALEPVEHDSLERLRQTAAEIRRVQAASPPAEPDDLDALLAKVAGRGSR
ncbi:hypothetical protein O7621_07180 [Solwaraspora sp. WMMD937]|uniref:Panacea domain-containing protein n=1 Tax=Solwaraspora sp. WMMD937 TaxID=3016090 RepID=UPI00249BB34E|nr:hypothetical protein [Solwaraspora sp. WMMD937]WFE23093.1 hypothetical protein O7621_07180 [Solwaraspora sp. WMMD937]